MCKIEVQGHACGHDITLGKDPCFLVKNKLLCSDEAKKQVRKSNRGCKACRKLQRQLLTQGPVAPATEREEPRDSSPPILKYPAAPKVAPKNPATIIANLKALCAKVAMEKGAGSMPDTELTQSSRTGLNHIGSEASIAGTDYKAWTAKKPTAAAQDEAYPRKVTLTGKTAFFDLMDEMDDLARKPHMSTQSVDPSVRRCQGDHRRSELRGQPWTRDGCKFAVLLGTKDQLRNSASLGSRLSSSRNGHYTSPLTRKLPTGPDKKPESFGTKCCARRPLPLVQRRYYSNVSTASARSAKRKINAMLSREFEQTAHLGDIVLLSPENSLFSHKDQWRL